MSDIQDLPISSEIPEEAIDAPEHIAVIEIVEPKKEYPVGIEADLIINVRCPEGCDLRGGTILIGDESDHIVAEQPLAFFNEEQGVATTGNFSVQIPREVGEYTWSIVFFPEGSNAEAEDSKGAPAIIAGEEANGSSAPAESASEVSADATAEEGDNAAASLGEDNAAASLGEDNAAESSAPARHAVIEAVYSFKAVTHVTGMTVYRDYQPVVVGSEYTIIVGIECLTGCSMLGQNIQVFCEDELLATAAVGEPAGILSKLYQASIKLTAPDEVGLYELKCCVEPEGLGLAHTSNVCRHYVTTRLPSQGTIDITVVDSESLRPMAGVELVVRPKEGYPSWWHTNQEGKALVDIALGEHTIGATHENYKYADETVTLSEGQETIELTIPMEFHEPVMV